MTQPENELHDKLTPEVMSRKRGTEGIGPMVINIKKTRKRQLAEYT